MYASHLFEGLHILVTGGRSGIGYGIAASYLRLGASVTIASRNEMKMNEACAELSELGPCDAHVCDIRQVEEVEKLAAHIKEKHGKLDVLINNAGGQFPAPAEVMSLKGWSAVVNNNLNGTFFVTQIMANTFFIPQKSGNIVNIIVDMHRGFPGMAHTGAARAGVENLTKTLAQEWAEYNIRVNAVAPGIIESSGLDTYPPPIKDHLESIKNANLMRRLGTVEDVSNAVMFLSSKLSSYTSGTTVYVDGMDHLAGNRMDLYLALKKMMG